jgi:hypothetical protein
MKKDEDPKFWVQVLKLVIGVAIIIALVGLGLWHASTYQTAKPPPLEDKSWGIVTDSPIRK